jgi:hypothetical protein
MGRQPSGQQRLPAPQLQVIVLPQPSSMFAPQTEPSHCCGLQPHWLGPPPPQ